MKTPHLRLKGAGFLGAALLAQVAMCADYPTTISSFSPLAYWRFNETAASPAAQTFADSSTTGTSLGYAAGPVTNAVAGIVGNAVRFGNAPNQGSYVAASVDVPWNATINPNAPFSVEGWINPADPITDTTGLCPFSSMSTYFFPAARVGWLFYVNNTGTVVFRIGGENSYVATPAGGAVTVGAWSHIAGTFDGTTARVYVNGVEVANKVAGAGFKPNGWTRLRLGGTSLAPNGGPDSGLPGVGNRSWDGSVDEVAVYNTVLSASTIAAHYAAATTNNAGYHAQILASNPVGYWELEEPTYVAPNPSTYPTVANTGSAGAGANGTASVGIFAAQSGPPYGGFGPNNNALNFSGVSGTLSLAGNPDSISNLVATNITLMAWIKPSVLGDWRTIISHGYDSGFIETYLRIGDVYDWEGNITNVGPNAAYYEVGATADATTYNSATYQVPPGDVGNWVFIAGTWDGANWNLYRNGLLVAQYPDTTGPVAVTNRWSVGSRSDPSGFFGMRFGGSIDEPAIIGSALSPTDIQNLYLAAQVPPVITRAIVPPTPPVYEGSSISFNVWAEGNPTLQHVWYKNGVSLGITATNITLNNLTTANSGTYSVVITNAYGSITNSVVLNVLTSLPIITSQPTPATRWSGFAFTFSVSAIGSSPISYQWQRNGVAIGGATSASYSAAASGGNAGNYTCVLTNPYGAVTSSAAALTVLTAPNAYVTSILGDAPIAYYRLGETNGSTVAKDYAGGHDGTYHNVDLGEPGYTAIDPDTAMNARGTLNSYCGQISGTDINFQGHTNFTLEVWVNGAAEQSDAAGIIAKGTADNGSPNNANEQFCIDISAGNFRFFTRGGANSLYEADATVGPNGTWQHLVGVYDDAGGHLYLYVNGQLSGSPGNTRPAGLRVSSAAVGIGARRGGVSPDYDLDWNGLVDEVAIYNYALSAPQVAAHYAAAYGPSLPPTITVEPTSLTNFASLDAKFVVGAYGTVPLNYQWYKGASPLSDGGSIAGSSTAKLTLTGIAASDAGNYYAQISNVNGTTNSSVAVLTVLNAPSSPPAIPGLVVHLPFDNNLFDVTGRGNNGTSLHTVTNIYAAGAGSTAPTPADFVPGVLGQAYHYTTQAILATNGTAYGTNTFYASLGVRPDLQFSSNVDFSVALWIRLLPDNYVQADLPFFTDTINSTFGNGLVLAPTYGSQGTAAPGGATTYDGGWAMSLYDAAGVGVGVYGDLGSINGPGAVPSGDWHHLVYVFQRGAAGAVYLDGKPAHSTKQNGTFSGAAGNVDNGNAFMIGQDPTGMYGESGEAYIDDLGVWRKALTPLEAASIFIAAVSNNLSYVGAPITLSMQKSGSQLKFTWPAGTLQSADIVTGPYTDVTPVSPLSVTPTAAKKFYRVRL
jgi:hypothetical protein